jgi:AcrR family transcriptional regulator
VEPLARPTRQARSAATTTRLLQATEAVLTTEGLEGATVPAIARCAGVAVGSVYRRFPNKDALLRATYLRIFDRAAERNATVFQPEQWKSPSLRQTARRIVDAMAFGYQTGRPLLRALHLYARSHPDPDFRRRANEVSMAALGRLAALLDRHRAEIRHPRPARAIRFGLLSVAFVLRELTLSESAASLPGVPTPDELPAELTRQLLGYLGVADAARSR